MLAALLALDRVSPDAEGFSYRRIATVAGLPERSSRTFHAVHGLCRVALVASSGPQDTRAAMRFRLTDAGWWRASNERAMARSGREGRPEPAD